MCSMFLAHNPVIPCTPCSNNIIAYGTLSHTLSFMAKEVHVSSSHHEEVSAINAPTRWAKKYGLGERHTSFNIDLMGLNVLFCVF